MYCFIPGSLLQDVSVMSQTTCAVWPDAETADRQAITAATERNIAGFIRTIPLCDFERGGPQTVAAHL
jgi:hypothetical protein